MSCNTCIKECNNNHPGLVSCEGKEPTLQDSGKRIAYGQDKAEREPTTGKGRFDLVSPFALERLAIHYENGAKKYADRNWEKGMPKDRCIESAMRHINEYMKSYVYGHELVEDHLAAACWNLMAIMHFEETE